MVSWSGRVRSQNQTGKEPVKIQIHLHPLTNEEINTSNDFQSMTYVHQSNEVAIFQPASKTGRLLYLTSLLFLTRLSGVTLYLIDQLQLLLERVHDLATFLSDYYSKLYLAQALSAQVLRFGK